MNFEQSKAGTGQGGKVNMNFEQEPREVLDPTHKEAIRLAVISVLRVAKGISPQEKLMTASVLNFPCDETDVWLNEILDSSKKPFGFHVTMDLKESDDDRPFTCAGMFSMALPNAYAQGFAEFYAVARPVDMGLRIRGMRDALDDIGKA